MRMYPALASLFFLVNGTALAHEVGVPATIEDYALDRVTEHIYVVHGTQALPSARTRGFMNNPAAILTPHGIIIVDPGSSTEIARQLLKKVRAVSDQPVIAVFNTHVHGDHWLGNYGIREAYPGVPIYAHRRMIERVEAGAGGAWLKLMMGMTDGTVAGTKVVGPNIGLDDGDQLTLDGTTLRFHHRGHAHTDHDLMIEVVNDKGYFTGDVVANHRVPNSDVPQDASFNGTIKAIKDVLATDTEVFIPGHGHSGGREVPEASLNFLQILHASVKRYFEEGLADYEMKDRVIEDLAEYRDWNNFNEMGRVINFVYREIERDNF